MGICDYLGPDFKNNLVDMIKKKFSDLCNNPSKFIEDIIDVMQEKISKKLRASTIPGSGAVRIAMETALSAMKTQSGLVAAPLQVALATPPAMAACKAGESDTVLAVLKRAIDTSFARICGDTAVNTIINAAPTVAGVPTVSPQMPQQMMPQQMMPQQMMPQQMMPQQMMPQQMMPQQMMPQQMMPQQMMPQQMMPQQMMPQQMMPQQMMYPMAAAAAGGRRKKRAYNKKSRKSKYRNRRQTNKKSA